MKTTKVFCFFVLMAGCSLLNREGPTVTCEVLKNGKYNGCANGILAACVNNTVVYQVCENSDVCRETWQVQGAYRCSQTDPPFQRTDLGDGTGGESGSSGSAGAFGGEAGNAGTSSGAAGIAGGIGGCDTTGRFIVQSDSVKDTTTMLVWQRSSASQLLLHSQAVAYCSDFGALPTVGELQSIIDPLAPLQPRIDICAFPDTASNAYWSDSADPATGEIYLVDFSNNTTILRDGEKFFAQARCVQK